MMEMTINVKVTGLDMLAAAINRWVDTCLASAPAAPTVQASAPAAPTVQASAPVTPTVQASAPVTPTVQASAPVTPTVQANAPAAPTVPTSTVAYTLDDLARAAMALMDNGRQMDLQQLLVQFGADSLPALSPGQYGSFATALRGLGAKI